MTEEFVNLHLHSNYSLLRGASRLDEIVSRAKECGANALALTDRNGLYGAIPFYKLAREAGIKPILGVEVDAGEDAEHETAVCLARDREGYASLCRIITDRQLCRRDPPDRPYRLADSIARHREGVIVLSASPRLLPELARRLEAGSLYV